jgi:tellurite resistance protein
MLEESKKSCLINLWLMAYCDGEYHPNEKKWIQTFIREADVDPADAEAWFEEIELGGTDWRPIADRGDARDLLKIAVGVIGADGRLDERERTALFQLGKALGFEIDDVAQILSASWGRNVMLDIFPTRTIPPPPGAYVIVTDDFEAIGRFKAVTRGIDFEQRSFEELSRQSGEPAVVVVHAADDREASMARLDKLVERLPRSMFFFVVDQRQANQVGQAFVRGVTRCVIEPVFKNEFTKLLLESPR